MNILNEEFFNKSEKLYPDNFTMAFGPEAFLLGVQLGDHGEVFALSPAHAKRLVAHVEHVIASYEKSFGKIVGGEWSPNIPSPIQFGNNDPKTKK